ncbi:hypothetical protein [Rhodanobacter glycinis]|uniref:hypothetical protein n=1 Tax=Rhodanobacter glycinis TaxID=582702 RepID=UPI00112A5C0F|nr:hypothetical protein [Rhodanobacter glycinis]
MSSISKHHRELNESGEGKCSVPMWSGGCPNGFCDNAAYGEPEFSQRAINRVTGQTYRLDGRYDGYVPGLACHAHGGPRVRTFMDGSAWCAVLPDFINLQESNAGFGETREAAIAQLGYQP